MGSGNHDANSTSRLLDSSTPSFADFGIDIPPGARGEIDVLCPRCSHTRKKRQQKCLSVNVEKGVWMCMHAHCGWTGGLGVSSSGSSVADYGAPLREAERARVFSKPATPPEQEVAPEVVSWFVQRGIEPWVLERAGISSGREYCPQLEGATQAIRFPYFRDGELVNIKYRAEPKAFWMCKGAERILYGLDETAGAEWIVIVEGELDKLSIDQAKMGPCVSVPDGAPAVDASNYGSKFDFLEGVAAERLAAATTVIIATDMDAPGEKLAEELARRIGPGKCRRARWPDGCKDANETLVRDGVSGVCAALAEAQPYPIPGIVTVRELYDALDELYEHGYDKGCDLDWPVLDRHYHVRRGLLTVATGSPGSGKALALDTELPTPSGWTTMGEVRVGDLLIDEQGVPTTVVAATEVIEERPCYRLTFSDGTSVTCDAQHEWVTRTRAAYRSARNAKLNKRDTPRSLQPRGTDQSHKRTFPAAVTTEEIANSMTVEGGRRLNHAVEVAHSLSLPDAELRLDPYLLGVWLGDGHSLNGAISTNDWEVIDNIEAAGFRTKKWTSRYLYGVQGLNPLLRTIGVFGRKHIPRKYLRASERQRLSLLQGLMDTDGYIDVNGSCEFTSTSLDLARGVRELVLSLGIKAAMTTGRAKLNGKDCGPKYRVGFTTNREVFRLSRKLVRLKAHVRETQRWRYIVSCERVASVPVRCVQVDSSSHQYLATRSFIPTHNSHLIDNIMTRLACRHGWTFAVCSPENQPLQRHAAGLISVYHGLPFTDGPTPRMSRAEMHEARAWANEHFTFVLPADPTLENILERAEVLVQSHGIAGLVIDPWNELSHNRPPRMTTTEFASEFLTRLRNFARRCQVHVWLVAHPTKLQKTNEGKYPVPTPYDISDSSHFYNKADTCLSVWRNMADETQPAQVHVQKVRFAETGQVGMVEFLYEKSTGRFYEVGGAPTRARRSEPRQWGFGDFRSVNVFGSSGDAAGLSRDGGLRPSQMRAPWEMENRYLQD